jgi:hypothetical protein
MPEDTEQIKAHRGEAVAADDPRVKKLLSFKSLTREDLAVLVVTGTDALERATAAPEEVRRRAAFEALTEGNFFTFEEGGEGQEEYIWQIVDAVLDAYRATLNQGGDDA